MMNKNTLRNGDMVVMNNGKQATYMVVNGTPIFRYHSSKGSFSYVNKYSDDLVHPTNDEYTVHSVYRVNPDVDAKVRNDAIFNPDKMFQYGINIANRTDNYTASFDYTDDYDEVFDLDDTQTGDMILCANGKFGTVFRNVPNCADCVRFHTSTNSFMPFRRWDGLDHKTRPDYNIQKIFRADTEGDTSKLYDVIGHPDRMTESGVVVFDRDGIGFDDCDWDVAVTNLDGGINTADVLAALGATTEAIQRLVARLS